MKLGSLFDGSGSGITEYNGRKVYTIQGVSDIV